MGLGSITCKMVNNMEFPLYVVVGGSSALGTAVVSGLLGMGRKVVGTSRTDRVSDNPDNLNVICDVTCLDDCRRLATTVFGISNRVFVVFLSGISINAMVHKASPDDWHRVMAVNLEGAFLIARSFLPEMRKAGYGRFAFAGSVTGRLGAVGTSSYSSSKEGLKALSRVIACENAAKGITSNTIEIGYMDSGLTSTIPAPIQDSILKQIPAARFGDPNEITDVLLMLEHASYMNGSVISLSGGL